MKNTFPAITLFTLVSSIGMQASLEDILAPLPKVVDAIAVVANPADAETPGPKFGSANSLDAAARVPTLSFRAPEARHPQTQAPVVSRKSEQPEFPITADDFLRAIEDEVDARLKPVVNVTLVPVKGLPNLSGHQHPFSVRIGEIPPRLRGTIRINVQVENDQGVVGNWDLYFQPHLYSDVWFPRSTLRAGDLASNSDFEARRVDLLVETDAVIARSDSLQRREYSRDIRPGGPLKWTDLVERSLVRRGQVVDVVAYQGRIAISMRAKAEQDGVEGDMVFLQNLDSNKKFAGEVIGEGRVQVSF